MPTPWSRRAVVGAAAAVAGSLAAGCVGSSGVAVDGECTDARVIEVERHYTLPEEDQDKIEVTVSNRASAGGTVVVEFRYYPRPGHEGEPTKRETTTVRVGADDAVRFVHRLFPPADGGHRSIDAAVIEQDCGRRSGAGETGDTDGAGDAADPDDRRTRRRRITPPGR